MIVQTLRENWRIKNCRTGQSFSASMPGSVYETWMKHGAMADPYWRDREDAALKMMEDEYEFCLTAQVSRELADCEEIWLRFEGIDTLADICLNGTLLGRADNMHRIWEYPVNSLISMENEVRVLFHSPTAMIKRLYEENPYDGAPEAMRGFPYLRKAHCSFGWDWGPRLPDMGLFRSVSFIGAKTARIHSVQIRQRHDNGRVILYIRPEVEMLSPYDAADCSCEIKITGPDGIAAVCRRHAEAAGVKAAQNDMPAAAGAETVWEDRPAAAGAETAWEDRPAAAGSDAARPDQPLSVTIEQPKLWWPNGYGDQPLYQVELILKSGEKVLDVWNRRIGLRTMTVNTGKDSFGSRFAHVVNGAEIFAMGADYIPEDCIKGRIHPERTRRLLEHCRECNFNVIRVWGGGYYPDDSFYDICDELGLIVWQDFMFACAVYHLTPEFEANVAAEIHDNVTRIRHHACLGLWCGNNEMELFLSEGQWVRKPIQKTEYLILNQRLIPKLLKQYDPDTFYWPSSPSSGGDFDLPNDPDRGDTHDWEVWHGGAPFTEYRKHYFRYLSEFGFQSFPAVSTIESFTEPEDRNIFSYVMEKHQKNNGANGKFLQYMSQMYRYPQSLSELVYVSQLLAAEAIRYGVEHCRRNRGRCMGCVYWQLNDCWPAVSWSSIDYYGRWKALHYFARRFFAPVLLSCEEEGALTSSMNVNEEGRALQCAARFCVTNETRRQVCGVVKWSLRNAESNILKEGDMKFGAALLSTVTFPRLTFPHIESRECYLSYELWIGGDLVCEGTSLFVPPKHFRFQDPKLRIWVKEDELLIQSDAYAKGIEIESRAGDLLFSDNYFDMNAGIKG